MSDESRAEESEQCGNPSTTCSPPRPRSPTAFGKHPDLIVREAEPFNAGPPLELLRASFITPPELFYVRNHGAVPQIDEADYRLSIAGLVARPLQLSLDDVRRNFSRRRVVATLHCAGNRRDELARVRSIPNEVAWGAEAIGNAAWTGAPLNEILQAANIRAEDDLHVAFTGLDEVERKGQRFGFGGSIPLEKALRAEVLLAYEMNDAPLAPVHGYPLRVVVPGYIGARSVKWLSSINVQSAPSDNYFQAHAYKLFPSQADASSVEWSTGLMLGEESLNAVICRPREGEIVAPGALLVQGYAVAGGNRQVERVDISNDGGATWSIATLMPPAPRSFTWCLWEATLEMKPGAHELIVRAFDSAANTQPEYARHVWNFKGYMNNAWHRVQIHCAV